MIRDPTGEWSSARDTSTAPKGACRASLVFVALIIVWAGQTEAAGPYSKKTAHLTWEHMMYWLPASATKSGAVEKVRHKVNKLPAGWGEWVQKEKLKPGVRLPAVLYLHGCTGIGAGYAWGRTLAGFGYAVFLPDSFARPRRGVWCDTGDMDARQRVRRQELDYALVQIRKLPWVDQERVVLMGFSEGAQAVTAYPGREFVASILIGTDCRFSSVGARGAPAGIPVLNIVGSNDDWGYGGGCSIEPDARGSKSVVIKEASHAVDLEPEALAAMAEFLETCCGKAP